MDKTKKKKKKASVAPDDAVIDDRSAEEKAQDKIDEQVGRLITFPLVWCVYCTIFRFLSGWLPTLPQW